MDWVVSLRENKVAISVSHVITASTPSSSSSSKHNFHRTNREEGEGGDQIVHVEVNQIPIGGAFNRTRCRRCNLNHLWWQLFFYHYKQSGVRGRWEEEKGLFVLPLRLLARAA